MYQRYPEVGKVKIRDPFWTPYLEKIRYIMLPYVFKKFEEIGYVQNFISVANKDGEKHMGPPFSDGLLFESLRGACDFLADDRDPILEAYIDRVIGIVAAAMDEDGFLCTDTMQSYPEKRWGDNDGDIVHQHDLYDHGTLVEAAISHYKATGKTTLLQLAVRSANLICATIGKAPKKNIIPGHSQPEEAFVKLYRLFRDDARLAEFAVQNQVNPAEYLDIAEFWYDARGDHNGRFMAKRFRPEYNQDHVTFAEQTEAVGHSVRAMLCYLGATVVAREKNRPDFLPALRTLWDSVVYKKLHISGGIGARHDIEGFDIDYHLPNKAYLETCAGIGLAFWNTEMNLTEPNAKYFDCFERSLYNNILSAIGDDFRHFFYQNPLESDGQLRRWAWHGCPCCPPMLLKLFSALNSFIYSYNENSVTVNMQIGSRFENEYFTIEQNGKQITVESNGKPLTVRIRIPEYVENFSVKQQDAALDYQTENGYAVLNGVWTAEQPLTVEYNLPIRRIFANPKVAENHGKVAVTYGPYVMCAEGIDNNGAVDFEIAAHPAFEQAENRIFGTTAQGTRFCLLPYYQWCNRGNSPTDAKMAVWFKQQDMRGLELLAEQIGDKLYGIY